MCSEEPRSILLSVLWASAIVVFLVCIVGCGPYYYNPSPVIDVPQPILTPPAGTYPAGSIGVAIDTTYPDATIHYTLDATDPDVNSPIYTAPIVLAEATTVSAIAVSPDGRVSPIARDAYTFLEDGLSAAFNVLFDSRPLTQSGVVSTWYWDASNGDRLTDVSAAFDPSPGRLYVANLPDFEFGMGFILHLTGERYSLPGNYRASDWVEPGNLSPEELFDLDLDVYRVIALLQPYDNSSIEFSILGDEPLYGSPLTFEWASMVEAERYNVRVSEYTDSPEFQYVGSVFNQNTTEARWTADLAPNAPDHFYSFLVQGYNPDNVLVGELKTTYTNGYGRDFRFRIQ